MKNLLCIITFLAFSLTAFGQTVIVVEPDAGLKIGALNEAISKNGGNVIYELKRDAIYYINGLISTSQPLHIRAQSGTGKRPILQPAVDANGVSTRLFSLGANSKLEGLYITGLDDMGNINKNIIRVEKEGVRLEITDCIIDYDTQCPIRLQVSGVKAYVKDCIIRNIINVNEPNDGKLIDTRGNKTDSICFDNNTIIHTGDLAARIDDAFVRYFHFDHNTFYLSGDGFDLSIILEVVITNNIFYNMNWQGSDTTLGSGPEAFIKCDSLISLDSYTDADRSFKITNNNIYMEQKYIDAMTKGIFVKPVFASATCEYFIKSGQMDTTNTLHEALVFDNPPAAPMDYILSWHTNKGELIGVSVPNFYADKEKTIVGSEDDFSFNYNKSSKSATASLTRGPLGATRWTVSGPTGINFSQGSKAEFTFHPIPAREIIYMSLNADKPVSVNLKFYNLYGAEVKAVNLNGISKTNRIAVDISDLTPGIYIYSYQIENALKGGGKLLITN